MRRAVTSYQKQSNVDSGSSPTVLRSNSRNDKILQTVQKLSNAVEEVQMVNKSRVPIEDPVNPFFVNTRVTGFESKATSTVLSAPKRAISLQDAEYRSPVYKTKTEVHSSVAISAPPPKSTTVSRINKLPPPPTPSNVTPIPLRTNQNVPPIPEELSKLKLIKSSISIQEASPKKLPPPPSPSVIRAASSQHTIISPTEKDVFQFDMKAYQHSTSLMEHDAEATVLVDWCRTLFRNQECYFKCIKEIYVGNDYEESRELRQKHLTLLSDSVVDLEYHQDDNDSRIEFVKQELTILYSLLQKPRTLIRNLTSDNVVWTPAEIIFIYKYRRLLVQEPRLFVTVLSVISWDDVRSKKDNIALLHPLCNGLTVEDALELLHTMKHIPELLIVAVDILRKCKIQEIDFFLPQLLRMTKHYDRISEIENLLAKFLMECVPSSKSIFNKLSWSLLVQLQHDPYNTTLRKMRNDLWMVKGDEREVLYKQQALVNHLSFIADNFAKKMSSLTRSQRVLMLQSFLGDSRNDNSFNFGWSEVFPLPYLPEGFMHLNLNALQGMHPESCFIFKSAMAPLVIPMLCGDKQIYKIIFKKGDDLRQDALMLQVIRFMDLSLKHHNINLYLTLYKCVATGRDTGLVEMVDKSHTLASILETSSIYDFLCKYNEQGPTLEKAFERYIKSCAGYCVITYLLGIGDRHLDNLLLKQDGSMFHIDFGFVLGEDPKPLFTTPYMRLNKEMMQVMYMDKRYHDMFYRTCCEVFWILRQYSNIICTLLVSMIDAGMDQINIDNIRQLMKENFALYLNTRESVNEFIINRIDESLNMVLPAINEHIHRIAQNL
ncbi:phosphatidylinositol 3-kinase, partial [Acrasis kona]